MPAKMAPCSVFLLSEDRAVGLPGSLPLLVPCTEHLAELEGRQVVGKLRHRKANPRCTFCALEFHSPAPAFSLEKPIGTMTGPPPRTKKRSKLDQREGTDWSQTWASYQGLTLLPCKQALRMWLHGPWRMDMQLLFKSAFILDYSMCMIWT